MTTLSWGTTFMNFLLKSAFKRLDFVKAAKYLANLEPGRTYVQSISQTDPAFADQEEIAQLAVELTSKALSEKGEKVDLAELKDLVGLISCRYDTALHQVAKGACYNLITTLFQSQDPQKLFVSADQRELRFLPELQQAKKDGLGVIYLINHSSHWDEFMFNVFLDFYNLDMPLFAAGQNMMATPTLTTMLMLGSYVIVRKGASRAYLSTLFHYCQALAEMGKPQGIFLEAWSGGARTRDGSLRYPRRLVTIQGSLASRGDVLIQPVVISYSRVPEDRDLSEGSGVWSWLSGQHCLRELLKHPLTPLKSLARGLKDLYGRSYLAFGQSRPLSDLKNEWSAGSQDLALDEFVALYAIREIAKDKKIMASQLVASALDPIRREDSSKDLLDSLKKSMEFIHSYHQRVFGQEPDFEDFVRTHSLAEVWADGLESLTRRQVVSRPFWRSTPKIIAHHALSYYATHSDRRLYSPSAKENLVVCGAGPWGFAMVNFIGRRTLNDKKFHNSSLSLYDPSETAIQALADKRGLEGLDFRLPKNVFPTYDHMEAFRKASEVIVAAPPEETLDLFKTIFANSGELKTLILASRGFDRLSHRLTIQMAWEAAVAAGRPETNILVLSGPFSPDDLLNNRGGLWVLAGPATKNGRVAESSLFKFGPFKTYLSEDPIGVQTAAALIDAYSLYGASLHYQRNLRAPLAMANFTREVSLEAKTLALALGGQPATFEADSPAWVSEFIAAALTGLTIPTVKLLVSKGVSAFLETQKDQKNLWPDPGSRGYYSIHSAYLVAKHLSLRLPHLEAANQMFWG
ncbi:MAG: 1-acyl-sn-glycerol-3-phosphate acyltransferase [Deltaproteobacteria bacterium]|jgi:glycerol-3-phosphate dehydrogenase/1-acyl-sn-glycerol-3-phosphate acyltransferase|nr:1-acyl-sn-glycerol-3-phosphate acyltransferase [Deltaproteobacteria bacterium]